LLLQPFSFIVLSGAMSYLEIIGLIVTGAGTLASVLGVFFAVYARQNGRAARAFLAELIPSQNRDMREFIAAQNKDMRTFLAELITSQNRDMREFLAQVLERVGNRIAQEGEKTREEIRRSRQSIG